MGAWSSLQLVYSVVLQLGALSCLEAAGSGEVRGLRDAAGGGMWGPAARPAAPSGHRRVAAVPLASMTVLHVGCMWVSTSKLPPPVRQASLEAMLLLRDVLVQLAPAGTEASLLGDHGGAASGWLGGAAQLATPSAATAAAAAAGSGDGATPCSLQQERQRPPGGGAAAPAPAPALPSIFFKAAAVIGESLVVCEWAWKWPNMSQTARRGPHSKASDAPLPPATPSLLPAARCLAAWPSYPL